MSVKKINNPRIERLEVHDDCPCRSGVDVHLLLETGLALPRPCIYSQHSAVFGYPAYMDMAGMEYLRDW